MDCSPVTRQALLPLTMAFFSTHWSGLLFPPPGDLPNPGTEPEFPGSPALQADSLPLSHQGSNRPHSAKFSVEFERPSYSIDN